MHTLVYNKGHGVVPELQENNEDDRMMIFMFCRAPVFGFITKRCLVFHLARGTGLDTKSQTQLLGEECGRSGAIYKGEW